LGPLIAIGLSCKISTPRVFAIVIYVRVLHKFAGWSSNNKLLATAEKHKI